MFRLEDGWGRNPTVGRVRMDQPKHTLPDGRVSAGIRLFAYHAASKVSREESMKTRIRIFPCSTRNLFAFHRNGPARERGPHRIRSVNRNHVTAIRRSLCRFSQRSLFECRIIERAGRNQAGRAASSRSHQEVQPDQRGSGRVERLGQRCARAGLRSNLAYKFHVIQSREINGFSLPVGRFTSPRLC